MHLEGKSFRGYSLLRRLTKDVLPGLAVNHYAQAYDAEDDDFQISDMDDTLECIRQLVAVMKPGHQHVRNIAEAQLEMWQGRRDHLLLSETRLQCGRRDYEDMVRIVMASGVVRSAENVREAFELGLETAVKDKGYRKYLLDRLAQHHAMTRSSIIRNRLIVTMALCLNTQEDFEKKAAQSAYMVFRTIDLTPERGWEWVALVAIM